jgi:hypothetical protein
MRLPPFLHPIDVLRSAEVIFVIRFGEPAALTRRFARLATGSLRTVSLVPEVSRIGPEHLSAAQALPRSLALHGPALLAADHLANERSFQVKRKSKGRGKGRNEERPGRNEEKAIFRWTGPKKTDEEKALSRRQV